MTEPSRYDVSGLIEAQYQPGSRGRVLRNLLGITSKREMDEAEAREQKRALEKILSVYTSDHRFKAEDICRMHKIWLGVIYQWAGRYRQVNLSKGAFPFAVAGRIPDLMVDFEKGPLRLIHPMPVCDATGSGSRPRCRPHGTGSHSSLPGRERSRGPHAGHCDGGASRLASPGFRSSERAKKAGILPGSAGGNGL